MGIMTVETIQMRMIVKVIPVHPAVTKRWKSPRWAEQLATGQYST